jgi:hypothetical protein
MINASPSLQLADVVSGFALATYLVKNGWSERPSKIAGISILTKQLGDSTESVELILPIAPGFMDEKRRVADALRAVEVTEGRQMKSIVDDVHRLQGADQLQAARSAGPEVRQTKPPTGRATEIERSGTAAGLQAAARRLRDANASQRILQVPQQDMDAAAAAMRMVGVHGTVKNMAGTKRRPV